MEQNLFDLQGEVAGGRHIPPNTRVLEMKDNPHALWEAGRTAVLERLKGENQALLKRLAEVEEALKEVDLVKIQGEVASSSGEAGSTLVPRESLDLVVKEKEELEDALKQKEKRLLRLQQVISPSYRLVFSLLMTSLRSSKQNQENFARPSSPLWE